MPYWQLFYHIVWATKNRERLLTPELEPLAHEFLRTKAMGLDTTVFALNGMPDHVHLVVSIPPKLAVATFIGQLKGASSTRLSKHYPPFAWQEEYGAFSFDKKRLPHYVKYVEGQKTHHTEGTLIAALEQVAGKNAEPAQPDNPGIATSKERRHTK